MLQLRPVHAIPPPSLLVEHLLLPPCASISVAPCPSPSLPPLPTQQLSSKEKCSKLLLIRSFSFSLFSCLRKDQGRSAEMASGVDKRVVFQKGGFGGCPPGTKTSTNDIAPLPHIFCHRTPFVGYRRTKKGQVLGPTKPMTARDVTEFHASFCT